MSLVQHRTVQTDDGARLTAYVREPGTHAPGAPTVVLAHGWTLDHRCWDPVIAQLPPGLRIVTWDQRGHGHSTLRHGRMRTGGESIPRLGQDLAHVIEALVPQDSPIVLCGHSMGGMTIMAYAGQQPAFLHRRVAGVVLASTASDGLRGPGLPGERLLMHLACRIPLRVGRLAPHRVVRGVFGRHPRSADVAAVTEQIADNRLSSIATFYFALMDHNETGSLWSLDTVPVSILVGARDRLTPVSYASSLAERLPHASLTRLPERGHMLPYEDTDTVVAAIAAALRGRTLGDTTDPELEQPFAGALPAS